MVGSPLAEAKTRTAGAGRRRGFPEFLTLGLALALLGACSAAPPPEPLPPSAAGAPATVRPWVMREFNGLSAAELVARLGEPDFRHAEPPAELWQYRGADCVLDLFLYKQAGSERVVYSEARDRSLVQAGVGQCAGGGDAILRGSGQTRL
jgi:hypothetical protein